MPPSRVTIQHDPCPARAQSSPLPQTRSIPSRNWSEARLSTTNTRTTTSMKHNISDARLHCYMKIFLRFPSSALHTVLTADTGFQRKSENLAREATIPKLVGTVVVVVAGCCRSSVLPFMVCAACALLWQRDKLLTQHKMYWRRHSRAHLSFLQCFYYSSESCSHCFHFNISRQPIIPHG